MGIGSFPRAVGMLVKIAVQELREKALKRYDRSATPFLYSSLAVAERLIVQQSGYRNRLLPIPLRHRQPQAHHPSNPPSPYVTEPLWTQMMPVSRSSQYILFWYIAETLPPDLENTLSQQSKQQEDGAYQIPERFPRNLTLKERVALEGEGYEPVRHENTGVDEEERLYDSCLLPVEEAVGKLKGTVMADVVRRGWEGICERREMEDAVGSGEVS